MNENGGNNTSAELQIVGSGEKIHGWGWHALMVGNVWVSLPVLTPANPSPRDNKPAAIITIIV